MVVGVDVMVAVRVTVAVTVLVEVGGSDVAVNVSDAARVGGRVTGGVSSAGGFVFLGIKIKARMRINPMIARIPYLKAGRDVIAFL